MPFTSEQVEKMRSIFMHLEPATLSSIQLYQKPHELRVHCILGIRNKGSKWICVFHNFENIKPYQLKILDKRKNEIPFEVHITYPAENITRVGWKTV
ncbi:hypothetical protein OIU80_20535 [Flavobacterium sp. LS1R47]|uniref:Uncharacterized protein n=2 Tax=Flavobacterium frigoritolerans TaxID=2987686 RepID=A0A9X3CAI9_9FLAO|nr:hypothetical protein [Flavobacterium frigoritolerans]